MIEITIFLLSLFRTNWNAGNKRTLRTKRITRTTRTERRHWCARICWFIWIRRLVVFIENQFCKILITENDYLLLGSGMKIFSNLNVLFNKVYFTNKVGSFYLYNINMILVSEVENSQYLKTSPQTRMEITFTEFVTIVFKYIRLPRT